MIAMLFITSYGQITLTGISDADNSIQPFKYDSVENFLGKNASGYINQELYLLPVHEDLQKYGYERISSNINASPYKTYNYKEISCKYFKVIDVKKIKEIGQDFLLTLEQKDNKKILYYHYSSEYKHSFPFLVVGHFEKMKQMYIGQEYIIRGKNWMKNNTPMYDISTGKEINDFTPGKIWKCIDITVETKYGDQSLLITNEKEEKLLIDENAMLGYYFIIPVSLANVYKKEIGEDDFNNILLNYKVKLGWSKDVCRLAWGNPKKINTTINGNGKSEQWVYENNYLYFENDNLTTIQ